MPRIGLPLYKLTATLSCLPKQRFEDEFVLQPEQSKGHLSSCHVVPWADCTRTCRRHFFP